ncbi:hypothetical protein [Sphaerotilus uruguayifluvii]|uniref:Uncharacterized protein n=1 Tax=Sphaerotilus uruguayifluvii TaxID=2735897 RepID=A0ABX2FZ04_9BURK|nr:hypothetical protein [Leptothrix sp. C29]NRT55202.1 hypothetical protein [Leptothrix sp. C29]
MSRLPLPKTRPEQAVRPNRFPTMSLNLSPLNAAVRRALPVLAAGLALGGVARAQVDSDPVRPLGDEPGRYRPLFTLPEPAGAPRILLDGAYAANAEVGRLSVEVRGAGAPADGVTPVQVTVQVFDRDGLPMRRPVLVTIELKGGARLLLPGASTEEGGAGRRDADRAVPGTQLRVNDGVASFSLIAPAQPGDVALRLTAGEAEVAGTIGFEPDVREMIAAGLIEGVIGRTSRRYDGAISPARVDDGFEAELRSWSRGFDSGRGQAAARAALFLKGKIRGDRLLTLAYDSDKDTRARLLGDIRPEEFYPVYGDASVKGFEARSSSRLYVRVDEGRSFAMFGDFASGEGVVAAAGGGVVAGTRLRQLGSYQRAMTGVKLHRESADGFVNVFASRDTLRHATEEIAANGTSGPFAVSGTQALENSEQIQLIVRDRNNLNTVLSVTTLVRLVDYSFEPFSGRILLTRPIPSQDADGNPIHLRVSYEVDQGGDAFWLAGADGQINLGERASLGGAIVEDRNPQARFRLASVHAGVKLGAATELVVEAAQTEASLSAVGTSLVGAPVLPDSGTATGRAARVELLHRDEQLEARLRAARTGASFANTAAGVQPGSEQVGASAAWKAGERWTLKTDLRRDRDTDTGARAGGATVGADYRLSPALTVGVGLRRIEERGRLRGALASLAANPSAGSYYTPGADGGFSGSGSTSLLNVNGALASSTGAAPGTVDDLDTTTAFVGATWRAGDRWTLRGLAEASVDGQDRHRVELAASYQLAERARLYARAEHQAGLSSRYALDSGTSRGQAIALGIDGRYMDGGEVFSEYRLRDASDGRASQLATGVRNVWQLKEGLAMTTGLERLRILDGTGQNATAATVGADWTASEWWKASGRLEWRRLEAASSSTPSSTTAGTLTAQDSWLTTLTAVRRLDRDWTALARNYYLATDNHGARANGWQDRFQVGLAWRPVDHNRIDVLGKYEYKVEDNINATDEWRRVHVGAVQANVHPARAWWASGRLAGKTVVERFPSTDGGVQDSYRAWLVGGRLIRDLTERWDLGLQLSLMRGHAAGQPGGAWQRSVGVEVGYLVQSNLWLSAGYNASGFSDRDLSSDYTARGAYLRLRFKFDADLFAGADPVVNRALPR